MLQLTYDEEDGNFISRRTAIMGEYVVNNAWLVTLGALAINLLGSTTAAAAEYGGCRFSSVSLRFAGTVEQTATCLLRKVRARGSGADLQPVPDWLLQRMTRQVSFTPAQLRSYLSRNAIDPAALTAGIAAMDRPQLRYFVIHDTSSPEIPSNGTEFPANINQSGWPGNNLTGWVGVSRRVNLIISRDGRSRLFQDWGVARPLPATKLEQSSYVSASRPIFVHVENIQPRLKPSTTWAWRAPSPGLGPEQEQRLALAYVVASMRAGKWLIPAYHFNIDEGIPDGHDDPQNMDLASWVGRVSGIEQAILQHAG